MRYRKTRLFLATFLLAVVITVAQAVVLKAIATSNFVLLTVTALVVVVAYFLLGVATGRVFSAPGALWHGLLRALLLGVCILLWTSVLAGIAFFLLNNISPIAGWLVELSVDAFEANETGAASFWSFYRFVTGPVAGVAAIIGAVIGTLGTAELHKPTKPPSLEEAGA